MYLKTSDQERLELGVGNYSCNWGIHIAGLYEDEQERDEIINGFLSNGILAGDLGLYVPAEQTENEFKKKIGSHCPGCKPYLAKRDYLQIDSVRDLYYPEGIFSPIAMDKGLEKFYADSQSGGRRNVRATAEMVWALDHVPGVEHLMAYESRLNYFIEGKPWISICLYNTTKFDGSTIMNVLRTHPYTLNGGILMQNPYFMDPDRWLAENAPQFRY